MDCISFFLFFDGFHPELNLTYATDLIKGIKQVVCDIGAMFDGDGVSILVITCSTCGGLTSVSSE